MISPPAGEYLIALPIRLVKTWLMRWRSTRTGGRSGSIRQVSFSFRLAMVSRMMSATVWTSSAGRCLFLVKVDVALLQTGEVQQVVENAQEPFGIIARGD